MLSADARWRIQEHAAAMPPTLQRAPASEEQLQEFESVYEAIPEDYRWFLLVCGGGYFGSEQMDDIVRLGKSHAKFRRESGPPRGWTMTGVFVVGWDGAGNPFGIETASGRVLVEDHQFGGIHVVAGSFEELLLRNI